MAKHANKFLYFFCFDPGQGDPDKSGHLCCVKGQGPFSDLTLEHMGENLANRCHHSLKRGESQ